MDNFMDVDQTASFLKIKKATLYQMTHMRRIPYIKLGGRLLFDREELIGWLKTKQIKEEKYK